MKDYNFTLGELFCGPGGMAIASTLVEPIIASDGSRISLAHSWGVDYSHAAIETFKANLGAELGIEMDARQFVQHCLDEEHRINALAFGFPCNSFSSVGEREGVKSKEYGELYKTGIKVINAYNPIWFIAENVSGINAYDSGSQFKNILLDLSRAGMRYNVVANLYKFEEYGVPQARHRYVIVGIRRDVAKKENIHFKIPAPTHGSDLKPFVTVEEALANVHNNTSWGGTYTRQDDKIIWRLKFTSPGENAWKLDQLVDKSFYPDEDLLAYLMNLPWYHEDIAPLGDPAAIRSKIEECRLHCSKARMSHIYKRLEAGKPSYTITGSGGGGTHVYHWREHRALTNEERAALQTFPSNFVFKGTQEQIRKQIGMAVPTMGAKIIFEAILKTFAHIPYAHIDPDPELVFPKLLK